MSGVRGLRERWGFCFEMCRESFDCVLAAFEHLLYA